MLTRRRGIGSALSRSGQLLRRFVVLGVLLIEELRFEVLRTALSALFLLLRILLNKNGHRTGGKDSQASAAMALCALLKQYVGH